MKIRTGIGQDSRRFLSPDSSKPCLLGGLIFEEVPGLDSESDGDVVIHAICNAITSVTGVAILGAVAHDLCLKQGITDSQVYLEHALASLGPQSLQHVAITIEGKRPRVQARVVEMREKLAAILKVDLSTIGITATTGGGLSTFGVGEGLHCMCIITTLEN